MIFITEKVPEKLSGISSLFITFDFNIEVVNTLKTAENYNFNPKTKQWELPITSLAYLLDELTYIDDITLQLIKDTEDEVHYIPKLVDSYKTKPRKHQLEGIEWGLNHNCGLLLDDPGLGKTLQMIYLAEELKEQKGLEHCLIICGINSLKTNWELEIKKHSSLTSRILGKKITKTGKTVYKTIKERCTELMNPIEEFFIIVNIETIRSDEFLEAFKKSKNKIDMIVFDEAHKSKNPSSKQGHNLLKLNNVTHKMGLTGTLILNNPLDAFTALKWIGIEKSNWTNFKSQYCVYGGFGGHQVIGFKNIVILKEEIEEYSLRRTKKMLKDLPPKNVIYEVLEMNDDHKAFYEDVKNGVKEECDKVELNSTNLLALTVRLMQATTCPEVLTSSNIVSTKIERAVELVNEIVASGSKVVIMSIYKEPLRQLYSLLSEFNPLLGSGDVSDDEFAKNVNLFQTDDEHKVFLGTTSKAGTGITLNRASYMICLNEPWTAALQTQVEDRIHRINNTEPVFVYKLACQGTIDEVIDNLVQIKQAMSDYIVDDVEEKDVLSKLKEYILDL